jgi:hypothetical protein
MTDTTHAELQEPEPAGLDSVANFIDIFRLIDQQIHELEERRDAVKREILAALGNAQFGTVKGLRAVRATPVVQRRLSTTAVRKKFTEEDLADCYQVSSFTRFSLIDGGKS